VKDGGGLWTAGALPDHEPDSGGDLIRAPQDIGGREAHNFNTLAMKPGGPASVMRGISAKLMDLTINLDRQEDLRAIEVQDVRPDRVLAPEVRTVGPSRPQPNPERSFWRCHRTAKTSGAFLRKDRRSHADDTTPDIGGLQSLADGEGV